MKLAAVWYSLILLCPVFARSDSQIPPAISPDLLPIFFELWRDSGYGRRPDKIEESAWILKKPSGEYTAIRWPRTWKKNAHFWSGPVPNGVVALAHTHTVTSQSKPSKSDIAAATRLHITFYIISDNGIWVVDGGIVKKVLDGKWDENVQITHSKLSTSQMLKLKRLRARKQRSWHAFAT